MPERMSCGVWKYRILEFFRERGGQPFTARELAVRFGLPCAAKTEGHAGGWFCMHCGEVRRNNFEAWAHAVKHPRHAWLNQESGQLEEP